MEQAFTCRDITDSHAGGMNRDLAIWHIKQGNLELAAQFLEAARDRHSDLRDENLLIMLDDIRPAWSSAKASGKKPTDFLRAPTPPIGG